MSQNVDDHINDDDLSKDYIDDNMKDREEEITHPEERKYVENNINDKSKEKLLEVELNPD